MRDDRLIEEAIAAWVRLTGLLKNTRIPQGMNYNEAIIMFFVSCRFEEDGVGLVSFKEIVGETHMLKSLVNRTLDSLERKGFIVRSDGKDKRTTYISPVPAALPRYHIVHEHTRAMVGEIVELIGEEDTRAFVRLANKISSSTIEP